MKESTENKNYKYENQNYQEQFDKQYRRSFNSDNLNLNNYNSKEKFVVYDSN